MTLSVVALGKETFERLIVNWFRFLKNILKPIFSEDTVKPRGQKLPDWQT